MTSSPHSKLLSGCTLPEPEDSSLLDLLTRWPHFDKVSRSRLSAERQQHPVRRARAYVPEVVHQKYGVDS